MYERHQSQPDHVISLVSGTVECLTLNKRSLTIEDYCLSLNEASKVMQTSLKDLRNDGELNSNKLQELRCFSLTVCMINGCCLMLNGVV